MFDFNIKPKITIVIKNKNGVEIPYIIPAPNKNLFDRLSHYTGTNYNAIADEILSLSGMPIPEIDDYDRKIIVQQYYDFLLQIKNYEKYEIPSYPQEDSEAKIYYTNDTQLEKIVSDYTGLNFIELENINICDFWFFCRCAVINANSQSKEGLEYLEKCWILKQDKPDRQSLKELKDKLERGKNNGGND